MGKVSFFGWGIGLGQAEMTKKRVEANSSMVPVVQAGEFSWRKCTRKRTQPDKLGERISKENSKSCTRCT